MLIQSAPLLLALGGIFVFGERFTPAQWLGLAAIVAGLAGFFATQLAVLGQALQGYLAGVSWIGVAAVTWAVYGLVQKQLLRVLSSQGVMLCIYAGCALAFWPFAEPARLAELSSAGAALLAFCALNTLGAYGAFAAALEHWEASRVSAVLALTPLATLAFAAAAARWLPGQAAPEVLSPAAADSRPAPRAARRGTPSPGPAASGPRCGRRGGGRSRGRSRGRGRCPRRRAWW